MRKDHLREIPGKEFHAEGTFNDHEAETNVAMGKERGGRPGTSHLLTLRRKSPSPGSPGLLLVLTEALS